MFDLEKILGNFPWSKSGSWNLNLILVTWFGKNAVWRQLSSKSLSGGVSEMLQTFMKFS